TATAKTGTSSSSVAYVRLPAICGQRSSDQRRTTKRAKPKTLRAMSTRRRTMAAYDSTRLMPALLPESRARVASFAASACLIALILLCVAWELFLAPIRPGGSWLVLKAVPLMIPLFGILRGRRYTYQWTTLIIWFYLAEGVVRAWSDT